MLTRGILKVALAVHLFSLGTVVNCLEGSAAHSLSIKLSFAAKERFPLKSLKLSIEAPDGRTAWQYTAEGEKDTDVLMKRGAVLAEEWYTAPGKYSLSVSYRLEGPVREPRQEKQEFLATGQELRMTADLWFIDDQEKHQTFLADLTIRRYLPGNNSVWLIQDWIPAREGQPRYQIVNSAGHPIYGVGWHGNFFGRIQQIVNGQWLNYPRGGFCGTVAGGQPIEANASAGSIEGYFIGGSNPFVTGRYRYVVQYSLIRTTEGVPAKLANGGLTRKRAQEIYEVSTEFYVEPNEKQ